jgi:hypothetical protein
MADYPAAITTFATLVDYVDYILASHQNARAGEIVAIETELGTDVAGSLATLKLRLAVALNDNGTLKAQQFSKLNFAPATQLTIASDAITITQSVHKLQPQSGTNDNLSTINGTSEGDFGILYVTDAGTDTIYITHGVGNIWCLSLQDISLSRGAVAWYSTGTAILIIGSMYYAP